MSHTEFSALHIESANRLVLDLVRAPEKPAPTDLPPAYDVAFFALGGASYDPAGRAPAWLSCVCNGGVLQHLHLKRRIADGKSSFRTRFTFRNRNRRSAEKYRFANCAWGPDVGICCYVIGVLRGRRSTRLDIPVRPFYGFYSRFVARTTCRQLHLKSWAKSLSCARQKSSARRN